MWPRARRSLREKVKNGIRYAGIIPCCLNMNELEDAVIMRIQALFIKEKPSWNLVMYSFLQVVDAFYAALQIRCTAHNLRTAGFTKYKITYQKGPTFSFTVYCCTQWVGWRSQRQSEKVNIRNACFLPVRAKSGRFCVLMQGRVFGHRMLSVFRTAATVHPPCWQNGGSYPPGLSVTNRFLVPANAKAGSATRRPHTTRSLAEGIIGHTQHFRCSRV